MYSSTIETKPSAKSLIAETRDVKVEDEESYVPTAILESNRVKKGWERLVTLRDP